MIRLKDLLFEDEVDDIFGNVAFGSDPYIAQYQNKPKDVEEDSELEALIASKLKTWAQSYRDKRIAVSSEIYGYEQLFRKAQNKFPHIFKPKTPNGTRLYRGILRLSATMIDELKQKTADDFRAIHVQKKNGTDRYWLYLGKTSYKPENDIQSWTSSQVVGHRFSVDLGSKYSKEYGSLLTTTQNDEFLFNQDFMNSLWDGRRVDEDEVIHFGKSYSNKIELCLHEFFFHKLYDYQPNDFYKKQVDQMTKLGE